MKKDIFASNKIKDAVNEIKQLVSKNGYFIVLFPIYNPEFGIGEKYSVVGKERNQTRISNLLKEQGVESKKIVSGYYIFFSQTLTKEEKELAEKDAWRLAYWYDIVD